MRDAFAGIGVADVTDALRTLDSDVASQDAVRGAGRLLSPLNSRMWAIEALGKQHRSQSLRLLYAGREFPVEKEAFKLGGHGGELGHVHIDFLRIDAAWLLKEIWICR